ncbi:MAG: hypothetical protein JXR76_11520, partial [Deltaproteobacteria bacterium]|nr:hypothetical protein [Deltaproteobacteria bacterium]
DTDSDGDTDTDGDTDSDGDTDTDGDTDSESDSDSGGPPEEELHVYLCFGQSNMSGQATITDADKNPPERLKILAAGKHSNRTVGEFYPAVPPLAHSGSQMSPADFFGRKMVAELPEHISVAIVNVSIGGQSIQLFDPATDDAYISRARGNADDNWWMGYLDEFGGNPYDRLVEMGKIALEHGKIKGILLHQGESDGGRESVWPGQVKNVYDNLLKDLGLKAEDVPLLVGELLQEGDASAGSPCCSGFNSAAIAKIPGLIPTAYIISSKGCPMMIPDDYNAHFNREGYEILGERYAEKMLELLGY